MTKSIGCLKNHGSLASSKHPQRNISHFHSLLLEELNTSCVTPFVKGSEKLVPGPYFSFCSFALFAVICIIFSAREDSMMMIVYAESYPGKSLVLKVGLRVLIQLYRLAKTDKIIDLVVSYNKN